MQGGVRGDIEISPTPPCVTFSLLRPEFTIYMAQLLQCSQTILSLAPLASSVSEGKRSEPGALERSGNAEHRVRSGRCEESKGSTVASFLKEVLPAGGGGLLRSLRRIKLEEYKRSRQSSVSLRSPALFRRGSAASLEHWSVAETRNTGREADGAKNQKEPNITICILPWVQGPQALGRLKRVMENARRSKGGHRNLPYSSLRYVFIAAPRIHHLHGSIVAMFTNNPQSRSARQLCFGG
jgi:hypothetical protein